MSESDERTAAERVLIVEDDPATRVGLVELVRTWGFLTASAIDGEEALQQVTAFRPAIVVTDLVMPRMDGLQLLRALREQASDASVVILTAQGTVESAVEAIKVGAYDYLQKPFEFSELQHFVEKVYEHHMLKNEVRTLKSELERRKGEGARRADEGRDAQASRWEKIADTKIWWPHTDIQFFISREKESRFNRVQVHQ